ncbi:conserved unknown protein [Ectocarpus siliculosus]|uniref:WD repeat protein mio zinc-ribbon like domain-containing protein n=1 Tax=Ectocarpus siliculosus TaxID=2880 RepID=D7FRA1_ECTSI|nr:conserved unknown protein [Ectocarpus siliculosus]|eukprot:CBJ30692.1 conserved unknown protein [Ectocarpus siliculosus]
MEAAFDFPLGSYSALNKTFTKLHVEVGGRAAAVGNNKSLLVFNLEEPVAKGAHALCQDGDDLQKRGIVYRYKDEAKRLFAIRFNPHHNRRMHLASAKGQLVHIWNLEDKDDASGSTRGVTTLRQMTTANVMDICWSRFDENLLAAGDYLWDTRNANLVQAWKVPGGDSRVLTTQVSFNRKNPYLLASSQVNQVYIWDMRKGQKPIDTIPVSLPSEHVTSLDWSSESLDAAGHLRLHNVEKLDFESPGKDLPAGDSSGGRDYGSTAGSESLETSATSKAPVIRKEILPVVWSLSEPQNAAPFKMAIETTSDIPVRELVQVENIARRGGFGSVRGVDLQVARKCISLVMAATAEATRPPSAHEAEALAIRDRRDREPGTEDAPHTPGRTYLVNSWLRVTARVQPAHWSREANAIVDLAAEQGPVFSAPHDLATVVCEDPLDEATVKRVQAAAEEVMHQPLKTGKSRLEACLARVRRDLDACVRDAANQAAGVVEGDESLSQRGLQNGVDGSAEGMLANPESRASLSDDENIPCPRRFGATFAANGTLVVFCSSTKAVRAGRKHAEGNSQQVYTYPRTYGCFKKSLDEALDNDGDETSRGGASQQPHRSLVADNGHSWFRPAWGDELDDASEYHDDDTYDLDRSSTEEVFVEEDSEASKSDAAITDTTRLPISHPDHSLGAGLGPPSERDGDERQSEDDPAGAADMDVEGELPWTPKFDKVFLLDCTGFLPGSPFLAAFYKLGPVRQAAAHVQSTVTSPFSSGERDRRQEKGEQPYFVQCSDTSVSSGGRSRRNSLMSGLGISSGMPPPISVPQRGPSATLENTVRSGGPGRRPSMDGGQVSELEHVAELPLDGPSVNVTPPRAIPGAGGESGVLSPGATMKPSSAHGHRTRQRLGKRRQHQQFARSPASSVDFDALYLRLGTLAPTSPADTVGPASTSPPMSDFGMDLGQSSASHGQATVNRSRSFSAGTSLLFGERVGDGQLAAQLGLSGRGHHSSTDSPTAFHAAGVGVRPRSLRGDPSSCMAIAEEDKVEIPTVGQLCRHNVRVAAARNCAELASVWALLAEAAARGESARRENSGLGSLLDARRLPRWETSSSLLTSRILTHHESCADPQTLASVASVVGSGSRDGGCAGGLPQGGDHTASCDRYIESYAERCCQWGAEGERAETVSHQTEPCDHPASGVQHVGARHPHDTANPVCSVCGTLVRGRPLLCPRCGHGGHSKHIAEWFELERECPACDCRCWEEIC